MRTKELISTPARLVDQKKDLKVKKDPSQEIVNPYVKKLLDGKTGDECNPSAYSSYSSYSSFSSYSSYT